MTVNSPCRSGLLPSDANHEVVGAPFEEAGVGPIADVEAKIRWFKTQILVHEQVLLRHLWRSGMDASDAEDVVAEALLRAYATKDWPRFDRGRSYLFTIARNIILDAARRRKIVGFESLSIDEMGLIADEQPSAEEVVIAKEQLQCLEAAIERLPCRCRQVFILRRLKLLSMAEVALELGIAVSTVEKHLAKAMILLSRAMSTGEDKARPIDGFEMARTRFSSACRSGTA